MRWKRIVFNEIFNTNAAKPQAGRLNGFETQTLTNQCLCCDFGKYQNTFAHQRLKAAMTSDGADDETKLKYTSSRKGIHSRANANFSFDVQTLAFFHFFACTSTSSRFYCSFVEFNFIYGDSFSHKNQLIAYKYFLLRILLQAKRFAQINEINSLENCNIYHCNFVLTNDYDVEYCALTRMRDSNVFASLL